MNIVVDPSGRVRAIYTENLDLRSLGRAEIRCASHVEPDADRSLDGRLVSGWRSRPRALRLPTYRLAAVFAWLKAHG